jgi:hypothetical protein
MNKKNTNKKNMNKKNMNIKKYEYKFKIRKEQLSPEKSNSPKFAKCFYIHFFSLNITIAIVDKITESITIVRNEVDSC